MNVRSKFSKWLFVLLVVCGIFAIGCLQVDAAGAGGNDQNANRDYDIVQYKREKWPGTYNSALFSNIDYLCTVSTQGTIKEGEVRNACADATKDPTVHYYPAWKVLEGSGAYNKTGSIQNESFNQNTFLLRLNSGKATWREWYAGSSYWKSGDGNTWNENNIRYGEFNMSDYNRNDIKYAMVYLHKTTNGFDLYKNNRNITFYLDNGIDFTYPSSPAYFITKNNGAFTASNTKLYYNTVPHVLGTEGDFDMVMAIMDENSGRPVPVYVEKGLTGFASIYLKDNTDVSTGGLSSDAIEAKLKTLFPYPENDNDKYGYTPLSTITNNDEDDIEYSQFTYPIIENGAINSNVSLGTVAELNDVIINMGGPQFVGSIQIALSEAITVRNSTYAFMSTLAQNGGTYMSGGTITDGSNEHPENHYGAYKLVPRPTYYYFNGSTSAISTATGGYSGSWSKGPVVQVNMLNKDDNNWTVNEFKSLAIDGNENPNPKGINRNFKHTFTTYTRSACFRGEGNKCQAKVIFNYFNDIELVKKELDGKTYLAYKLIPKTGNCSSDGTCTTTVNTGFSTFYYSENGNNFGESTVLGAKAYSNLGNAWGVWRQTGWSNNNVEIGANFAVDVVEFPKSVTTKTTDYATSDTTAEICRFPWNDALYYDLESELNINFLNSYIKIVENKGVLRGLEIDPAYDEMVDVLTQAIRTNPDILVRIFQFTGPIVDGRKTITSEPNWQCNGYQNKDPNYDTHIQKYITWGKNHSGDINKVMNEAAQAICTNLGVSEACTWQNFGNKIGTLGTGIYYNDNFSTTYLAIIDALQQTDENNIEYGQHLAAVYYQYYTLSALPDEYTTGIIFSSRRNGNRYSFDDIMAADRSNIMVLNDEDRLGSIITGNVDDDGNAKGTTLETAESTDIGVKRGPELYLINETTGELYIPGADEENPVKCPTGYVQEGDQCTQTKTRNINRSCRAGYTFDITNLECVEIAAGTTYCPDGYSLAGAKCVSYEGTMPICNDGSWDPELGTCTNYQPAGCNTGYTLTDITEADKVVPTHVYSFAKGNGNFDLFKKTVSGVSNMKQANDFAISYNVTNANNYVEISGLNLDTATVKFIQVTMKNASTGTVGKIYYTTDQSTAWNEGKSKTFAIEKESEATNYTYTVDMSGGMWNSKVTALRFQLTNASSGLITVDNINIGFLDPAYNATLKCVSDLAPVCPTGFTLYKGRCYGFASQLSTIPNSYELDCSHITPASGEKVTIASFRVGSYVNFEHNSNVQVFTVPVDGTYYIELWGPSSGTSKGGYTAGVKTFSAGDVIQIYTGAKDVGGQTAAYSGVTTYATLLGTAVPGSAGSNSLSSSGALSKITKTGSEWFKKTSEIGNTTWAGEQGHSGNGYARITLYSANGMTATVGSKSVSVPGVNKTFGYTGTEQSIDLMPNTYTIKVYGAQGGSLLSSGNTNANVVPTANISAAGKLGGYVTGSYKMTSSGRLYFYVGGVGGSRYDDIDEYTSSNNNGGYNGGGSGTGQAGPGGGGATHVTTVAGQVLTSNNTSANSSVSGLLMIAGGGGASNNYTGTYGNNSYMNGGNGWSGWSGDYEKDNGGGGAGYKGGTSVNGDDPKGGYSGSSWASSSITGASITNDNRSGNGSATITGSAYTASLGNYIVPPTSAKELGVCFVHKTSVDLSGKSGLELYVNNGLVDKCGNASAVTCEVKTETATNTYSKSFDYKGSVQSVTLPAGKYKLEVWGARGGSGQDDSGYGYGGYSTGEINLTKSTTVYVYVGGVGGESAAGGWNGGGASNTSSNNSGSGGGGTDIRIGTDSLYARVIVAGGGGGAGDDSSGTVGHGGGTSGLGASGGTQTSGYSFGVGETHSGSGDYAGGGGGWYGGYDGASEQRASGGSGYVYTSATASSYPSGCLLNSTHYLTNAKTIAGNASMPNTSGGTETGHNGAGYAKITGITTTKTYQVCSDGSKTDITNNTVKEYSYTGTAEKVTLNPGKYKLEVWGAQGGSTSSYAGGKGGYSVGEITISAPTTLYVRVGGTTTTSAGGWNGGGNGNTGYTASRGGGGASDIRIGTDDVYSRVIVAGGGGGAMYVAGGYGGGTHGGTGYSGEVQTGTNRDGGAGSQTYGGVAWSQSTWKGTFGAAYNHPGTGYENGGGGGGWYGGAPGYDNDSDNDGRGGGGGSGYVYTSGTAGNYPSGGKLNASFYLANASTKAGNASFPSPSGGTETGHTGNGYVKITTLSGGYSLPIGSVANICSQEARLKIIPTCPNGVAFNVNTNKCIHIVDVGCVKGSYDEDLNRCFYTVKPNGCTNEGVLTTYQGKYRCYREKTPTCDDGFELINGSCTKRDLDRYENTLCASPYTIVRAAKPYCEYKVSIPLSQFAEVELTGEMNQVEVGKFYRFRNYVGYRSSASRAKDVEDANVFSRTAVFPAIDINFRLVSYMGDAVIGTTEQCRGNNAEGCGTLPSGTKEYKIDMKQLNNGYDRLFIGNRSSNGMGNQFSSTVPGQNRSAGGHLLSEFLWSKWDGENSAFKLDNDFSYLWSAIDVYFKFNKNEFCYLNADPALAETGYVDSSQLTCVPYIPKGTPADKVDQTFFMLDEATGEWVLNMKEDEQGRTNINHIYISTEVNAPNSYVDSDYDNLAAEANGDNNQYKDDRSDYVTGFKLAPDSDVFIDRVEIVNAAGAVVFAADAMTLDRCANGDKIETGATARWTQDFAHMAYDGGKQNPPPGQTTLANCTEFDPGKQVALDPNKNYYVVTYTKYVALNKTDIEISTPSKMDYISVDVQHLGGTNGDTNMLKTFVGSMANAALGDRFTIRSGKFTGTGDSVAAGKIIHNDIVTFDPTIGLTSKVTDGKFSVQKTENEIISRYYTVENNFMQAINEPMSSLLIPANGLLNKGITEGLINLNISGESALINAYSSWDVYPFSYYLGTPPDIVNKLVMKCTEIATNKVVELVEKDGACVYIRSNEYKDCKLYSTIENIGNRDVAISTNIRVHWTNNPDTVLNAEAQGELYNADGSSKYFLTETVLLDGEQSFPSTGGGNETGHAGHGYARITNLANNSVQRFSYKGSVETIKLPAGKYKLEVWGAQGGSIWGTGGKGGYAAGVVELNKEVDVNIRVGGHPADDSHTGGFNGGGSASDAPNVQVFRSPGGGATDIRIAGDTLADRIIIAGGGGGGAKYATNQRGGAGGGESAPFAYYSTWGNATEYRSQNYGASQTESCRKSVDNYGVTVGCTSGSLGQGASGCGGGYYGGGYYSVANRVYAGSGGSGYVRVATTKNKLFGDANSAEVLVQDNVSQNIYAASGHFSKDNDFYVDGDWTNNEDKNCWVFDGVDYAIEDLNIENIKIPVDVDCDNNPTVTNITFTLNGTYDLKRSIDTVNPRTVNIQYKLLDKDNNVITTCSPTTFSKIVSVAQVKDFWQEEIPFSTTCTMNVDKNAMLKLPKFVVEVNGGEGATHDFDELSYTNNVVFESLGWDKNRPGDCISTCTNDCTNQNKWKVNFDFVYTFSRNVETYETSKVINMQWTDYDVGTVSGSTSDKTYAAKIGAGNINRAPDDYMAFKNDTIERYELCTDYRDGNAACWRYEMNVSHQVDYYLWSKAITSVYSTHKTLTSTSDPGDCTDVATKFNGNETYGNVNSGISGSTHDYANSSNTDRLSTVCHGFSEAPNTSQCDIVTDWWGNDICDEYTEVFSDEAQGGTYPEDYIPYEYFQDYTLEDGYGVSATTATDRIILKNQKQTNKNQGSAHTGWVQNRTVDVCDTMAFMNISYSCDTYYTYGTANGSYKYNQTTGSEGKGICESVGYGTDERTCSWTDTTKSPPVTTWWDDSGATCYRQHRDYTCDAYYSFTKDNTVHHNDGNATSGTCDWHETDSGSYYGESTTSESAACSDSCSSDCCSWNKDKYGNPTTCASKCSCTASCSDSSTHGCASTSCSSTGVDASCTAPGDTGTYYYRCKSYEASDGQTYSDCDGQCGSYPSIGSYTFTHSETYDGSGSGDNMHYDCSSGDLDTGGYCYETYNDKASLVKDDERCIRWTPKQYKEIKYYTTSTPDSNTSSDPDIKGWVSRTYDKPSYIWQYTCDTKEPTVAYPTDGTFLMGYEETIVSKGFIKTERTDGQWVELPTTDSGNTLDRNLRPRAGEWFELKFVTTYNTTRGTKPGTMPYLNDFYNNYHNIAGGRGDEHTTVYPNGGYNHYGVLDSEHLTFGDNKVIKPSKFEDIVNNVDYGYCDARPSEPYGCSYNPAVTNQFMYPNDNEWNDDQGHTGDEWISNREGTGTCYYGPDNKTTWKKFSFGDDYDNYIYLCDKKNAVNGPQGLMCDAINKPDSILAWAKLDTTAETCLNTRDDMCVSYQFTWETPMNDGRRGFYLNEEFDVGVDLMFSMQTGWFDAVGRYEKELLGETSLTSNDGTFFMEDVGKPIKPLCRCSSFDMPITEAGRWGSTEWEVE